MIGTHLAPRCYRCSQPGVSVREAAEKGRASVRGGRVPLMMALPLFTLPAPQSYSCALPRFNLERVDCAGRGSRWGRIGLVCLQVSLRVLCLCA